MNEAKHEASAAAPRKRLPTGLKVAIGCVVVFFGFASVIAIIFGIGGLWLKGEAEEFAEGVEARAEAQQEATEILDRLGRAHPFTRPPDGRIDPASAERFLRATQLAWAEIEPEVRRLHEVAERNREGEARLGDVFEGFRTTGLLADSRLHVARALDEVGLSLQEYVWTGGALQNAWRDANAPEAYRGSREAGDPVTLANIELAKRHAAELQAMDRSVEDPNPSAVLGLARIWSLGRPSSSGVTP